jgi:hypothetical protein
MIGKPTPVPRGYLHRPMFEISHVNPVEPEPGCARGERARRTALSSRMNFFQAGECQSPVRAPAPVVEVAGNDKRRVAGHVVGDELEKLMYLPPAVRLAQREVQADCVQWRPISGQLYHGMQQPARLRLADRRIDIAPGRNGMPGEKRIAVMPARRDGIAPVGVLRPHAVREDFVLLQGRLRPLDDPDFLQKHEVRLRGAQGTANAQESVVPVSRTKSLMRVQRQHANPGRSIAGRRGMHTHKLYREA